MRLSVPAAAALAATTLAFATPLRPTAGAPSGPTGPTDDEEQAEVLAEAEELMLRLPLTYHVEAYELLAGTEELYGIEELVRMYEKPQVPKDQSRYLLASALGKKGGGEEIVPRLAEWREDANGSDDAWLWRHALAIEVHETSPDVALDVARNAKDVMLRGAAIEALAAHRDESLYTLVPELAKAMPKKDAEKIALMGSMATAVSKLANKRTRTKSEWKQMALTLIALLDDEEFPRAAKLVLARHLGAALDADQIVLEGNAWRTLIAQRSREEKEKRKPKKKSEDEDKKEIEYVKPSFFGVEVTGERICYLIDLSDSMAEPIPEEWRPTGAPTSGPRKRRKWKKGEIPTADDIPWYRVETRFDLAREHLRVSLLRLQPDQLFTVIGFGSYADYVDGCEGMVKASSGTVKKVLKALDEIEVGSPQGERVHGTLWGDTNMFAGIKLAYATGKKGEVKDPSYVALETFEHGADTLFVLSDGDPSIDDYVVEDVDYGDGIVVKDRESGEESDQRGAKLNYPGPYRYWDFLLEEVKRLNMLRELEIHVISVGDADTVALDRLAKIGHGKVEIIGKEN
ncbi:MAG: hypothetical protein AAF726_08515 [Planctomycetota bacterium]